MRRLLVTVLIAVAIALAAPPASAGGSTSVMITDPASGRATALYYTDSRYAALEALFAAGTTVEGEPQNLGRGALNLTWMVHDVQPWRTQQVYPDAEGGPLVVTYGTEPSGNRSRAIWHRIADIEGLRALLNRIFRQRAAAPVAAEVESTAPEPAVVERTMTETETAWYSLTGWRWLIPGLVIGAGSAILARGRRTEDSDPPLMLTDVAPVDEVAAQR